VGEKLIGWLETNSSEVDATSPFSIAVLDRH
jgi:hypothetical protein